MKFRYTILISVWLLVLYMYFMNDIKIPVGGSVTISGTIKPEGLEGKEIVATSDKTTVLVIRTLGNFLRPYTDIGIFLIMLVPSSINYLFVRGSGWVEL